METTSIPRFRDIKKSNAKSSRSYINSSVQQVKSTSIARKGMGLLLSFKRNEPWGVSSTNTRPSVLNRLVTDREFSKIVTDHFRFNFNLIEGLPIVDTNDAANHFRYNYHVAKMSPYWLWLLTRWGLSFLCQDTYWCLNKVKNTI